MKYITLRKTIILNLLKMNLILQIFTQEIILETSKGNTSLQSLDTHDLLKIRIDSFSQPQNDTNLSFEHENQLIKHLENTLLKLPEIFENLLQQNIINISETNQLELLNYFDTLISCSLIELSNEAIKNTYKIFTKSNFIRIRTKSQLYLNIFSQPK